jgi:hypothetical protein
MNLRGEAGTFKKRALQELVLPLTLYPVGGKYIWYKPMKPMRYLPPTLFLLILVFDVTNAGAQDYGALIKEAGAAYEAGDYAHSGQLYEQAFALAEPKGDHLYLATRSFVKANEPDKAFLYLTLLLDKGMALFNFLTTDEHLRPLHSDPRWQEFLAGMDRKLAEEYGARFNAALRSELLRMEEEDQLVREAMTPYFQKGAAPPDSLWKPALQVDSLNQARLKTIIAEHGWPEISMVGEDGASAAFLIAQHAPSDMLLEILPLLTAAAERGEADKKDAALMIDRALMYQGKPQIYGTQLRRSETTGNLELWPIEDEANVDKRRAEIGLQPLGEYLDFFGIHYTPPGSNE